jgi:hypothetical protein
MIVLQPVTLRIPNKQFVYSPSRLKACKKMSYREFLANYATCPRAIRVCYDEPPSIATLLERSEWVTAYGFGLDCWYIVVAQDET